MGGSPNRSNGYAKWYCWPASRLHEEEMRLLYEEKIRTGRSIATLIRDAVVERYGKDGQERCRAQTER